MCNQTTAMLQENRDDTGHEKVVVGSRDNFWIWSHGTGWDLTHPPTPSASPVRPRLLLDCEVSDVTIDPVKTALVIIDMQNFSMSRSLNTNISSPAIIQAQDMLLRHAIPAARKARIQIIWLNWGLTDEELETMDPGALRVFRWKANTDIDSYSNSTRLAGKGTEESIPCGELQRATGLGADLGEIQLADGSKVDAGRALMRGTWNAALHEPLASAFQEGQTAFRPDVLICKNRNSGLLHEASDCTQYLEKEGIRTLMFAGSNTDQCVMANLQDAFCRGFDTILLKDGCSTDSPRFAQQSAEFNCRRNWGFSTTCQALATAVDRSE